MPTEYEQLHAYLKGIVRIAEGLEPDGDQHAEWMAANKIAARYREIARQTPFRQVMARRELQALADGFDAQFPPTPKEL